MRGRRGGFRPRAGASISPRELAGRLRDVRADLALIDDPIASFEQAASAGQRELLWNWFRSNWWTRLKPGGRIALVMTRWHTDDLAGRLIEQGGWRVLRLPALAEGRDALGRAEGERCGRNGRAVRSWLPSGTCWASGSLPRVSSRRRFLRAEHFSTCASLDW